MKTSNGEFMSGFSVKYIFFRKIDVNPVAESEFLTPGEPPIKDTSRFG